MRWMRSLNEWMNGSRLVCWFDHHITKVTICLQSLCCTDWYCPLTLCIDFTTGLKGIHFLHQSKFTLHRPLMTNFEILKLFRNHKFILIAWLVDSVSLKFLMNFKNCCPHVFPIVYQLAWSMIFLKATGCRGEYIWLITSNHWKTGVNLWMGYWKNTLIGALGCLDLH